MALCMCSSDLIFVPTPCLECVHASVHVCMLTWVPNSATPPMQLHGNMGSHVWTLCVCSSQSTSGPTPCLEGDYIYDYIYV